MKSLNAARAPQSLTSASLAAVTRHCRLLSFLDISGCTAVPPLRLCRTVKALKQLDTLVCDRCPQLFASQNPQSVELLAACLAPPRRVLSMAHSPGITDAMVVAALDVVKRDAGVHNLTLRKLNLNSCIRVGDLALKSLAEHTPSLTHIFLACCDDASRLTDAGVAAFLNQLQAKLTHIDLSGCAQIHDATIRAIASCREARFVSISGARSITAASLTEWSELKMLEHVDMSGAGRGITDQLVESLVANAAHLQKIRLFTCPRISRRFVTRLRRLHPQLTIFWAKSRAKKTRRQRR